MVCDFKYPMGLAQYIYISQNMMVQEGMRLLLYHGFSSVYNVKI